VSPVRQDESQGFVGRSGRSLHRFSDSYGLVFVLIVATLLATATLHETRWGQLVTAVLMAATLLLTFRASRVPGQRRGPGAVVVVVLLAVAVIAGVAGDTAANQLLTIVIAALFVLAAMVAIVRRLRSQTEVTMRTVMGALCIYLFIGLFFAVVFSGVELVDDTPFFVQTDTPNGVDFVYYSFITQATVGYGDLTPATDLGRMLAITEALLGQVYLVTIVAVLVSNLGRARPSAALIRSDDGETEASGEPQGGAGPDDGDA
jgi:uncharacterized membrane protein